MRYRTMPIMKHKKCAGVVAVIVVLLTTVAMKSSIFANDGISTEQASQQTGQEEIQTAEPPTAPSATDGEIETRGGFPLQQRPSGPMRMVVPGSTQPKIQVVPPAPAITWAKLWDQVWLSIASTMPIEVAASVGQIPTCQGNLALDAIIKDSTWAIANRKYGEAARLLGLFQDRSHCLTTRGIRSLDAALTVYLLAALQNLQRDQADIALPGLFNLGLLVFDQLQYTKASFWRIGIAPRAALVQQILTAASSRDMGVWLYDFNRGLLVQRTDVGLKEEILNALVNPSRLGDGHCSLLEMADLRSKSSMGFQCPPGGGQYSAAGNAGQTGSGAVSGIVATITGGMCVAEVARTSGSRQQLACMKKAVAGIKPTPTEMLKGPVWSPPVLDKGCAISDTPAGGLGSMQTVVDPKVVEAWQEALARLREAKAENEMLKQTQEALAEAALISQENAILRQELEESKGASSGSPSPTCPPSKLGCGPGEDKRTFGDDLGGSGGCGKASNAAKRLRALYQCLGGPPRVPSNLVADPMEPQGKVPAAMACAVQGGDMPRMSMNDSQCAAMRCVEGAVCPCNRTTGAMGGQTQHPLIRPPGGATPDCFGNDDCGPKPTIPGGVPPKVPGVK